MLALSLSLLISFSCIYVALGSGRLWAGIEAAVGGGQGQQWMWANWFLRTMSVVCLKRSSSTSSVTFLPAYLRVRKPFLSLIRVHHLPFVFIITRILLQRWYR